MFSAVSVVADSTIEVAQKPQLHALVIGIGAFKNEELSLKYAVSDAELFGATLGSNAGGLFSQVNIIYLNKEANTTKTSILSQLDRLQNISENDTFVFFASTLERIIGNNYYMLTSDVQDTQDTHIKQQAISKYELIEAFKKIPAKNKLLLFDTSYSGVAIELAGTQKVRSNITSISASNSKQTALKINLNGHSIFTKVITDAIAGLADKNSDEIIDSSELVDYVYTTIPQELQAYDENQVPAFYQSANTFNITSSEESIPQREEKKIVKTVEKPTEVIEKPVLDQKKKVVTTTVPKVIEKTVPTLTEKKQSFMVGKFTFTIDNSSIYINVKNRLKKHFKFVNDNGENIIVLDFYANQFVEFATKDLQESAVSKIKIGYHGDSFRITIHTNKKYSYKYESTKDGIYINLMDK